MENHSTIKHEYTNRKGLISWPQFACVYDVQAFLQLIVRQCKALY